MRSPLDIDPFGADLIWIVPALYLGVGLLICKVAHFFPKCHYIRVCSLPIIRVLPGEVIHRVAAAHAAFLFAVIVFLWPLILAYLLIPNARSGRARHQQHIADGRPTDEVNCRICARPEIDEWCTLHPDCLINRIMNEPDGEPDHTVDAPEEHQGCGCELDPDQHRGHGCELDTEMGTGPRQ